MLLAAIVGFSLPFIVMFIILIPGLLLLKSKGRKNFSAYGLCGTFVSLLVGLLFVSAIWTGHPKDTILFILFLIVFVLTGIFISTLFWLSARKAERN